LSAFLVGAIADKRRGANSLSMDQYEITARTMFAALERGSWKLQPPSVREEWLAKARALHTAIDAGKWPPRDSSGL